MSDVNSPQGEEPVLEAGQEAAAEVPGSGADEASLDDWAAAMAEQNSNDAPAAAPAAVFQPLSKVDQNSTRNDIDMILDIPVQMTVEQIGRAHV